MLAQSRRKRVPVTADTSVDAFAALLAQRIPSVVTMMYRDARELELGQPLPDVSAFDEQMNRYYRRARCLIRLHTQPLGEVELELDKKGVRADEYTPHIWHRLGVQINEHLRGDGLPAVTGLDAKGLSSLGTPIGIKLTR